MAGFSPATGTPSCLEAVDLTGTLLVVSQNAFEDARLVTRLGYLSRDDETAIARAPDRTVLGALRRAPRMASFDDARAGFESFTTGGSSPTLRPAPRDGRRSVAA